MSLTRWPPWMLLSAVIAITATLLTLLIVRPGDRTLQHRVLLPPPAVVVLPILPLPSRVCATRSGMCPIGPVPVPAGGPCGCPDLVRGSVPGHVELLGGPSIRTGLHGWPNQEAKDPLTDLDLLSGP
jgi:hypothetical protein